MAAAAPADVPVPLTTTDLPPAKRKKTDLSPAVPATAAAGWSSLPDDLVRRIADSFLATNDLDHYVTMRAVCPSWRAATDDPGKDTSDTRFHPQTWIILDEIFQTDDTRVLLNIATGRVLHKRLPLLRDYYVVTTTDGFFVLADRSPPHTACVFNPLTGNMVRFTAPVPPGVRVAADVGSCVEDSSLSLVLLSDSSHKLYTAVPQNEGFFSRDCHQGVYNFIWKAVVGGAYAHIERPAFVGAFGELCDMLRSLKGDPVKCFARDLPGDADGDDIRCFLVGLATHMVVVMEIVGTPFVLKMNTEIGKLVPVQSISRFAIFIGHRRCLPVNASKFPGIEANCIYYTEHLGSSAHICKFNIEDNKVERISEAAEFVKQDKQFVLVTGRPFTIIQLLCNYTINIPDSQLGLQQVS